MSCVNPILAPPSDAKPAPPTAKATPSPVVDELRILAQPGEGRDGDDLALFGLTTSESERRLRKSRLI